MLRFIILGLTLHSWLFIETHFSTLQLKNDIATTNTVLVNLDIFYIILIIIITIIIIIKMVY